MDILIAMDCEKVVSAIKYYQEKLRKNNERNAKKRQAKIDAGEYRPRGRPRKIVPTTPPSENPEVGVVSISV